MNDDEDNICSFPKRKKTTHDRTATTTVNGFCCNDEMAFSSDGHHNVMCATCHKYYRLDGVDLVTSVTLPPLNSTTGPSQQCPHEWYLPFKTMTTGESITCARCCASFTFIQLCVNNV